MKLYYSPGACSLSPHIALLETKQDFTLDKVDLSARTTESGEDFTKVNPKGYVPALRLDDGSILTENPVLVSYIGDLAPESGLMPAAGTIERYRVEEWLSYIGSELHKAFGPLFGKPTDEEREKAHEKIQKRLAPIEEALGGNEYLMGSSFTAADCYAFAVIRWSKKNDVALGANVTRYMERLAARPAVQAALTVEGLSWS